MIQIRAFFGDWKTVDKAKAKHFVIGIMSGMLAVSTPEKRAAIVEERHLHGITVKELMEDMTI